MSSSRSVGVVQEWMPEWVGREVIGDPVARATFGVVAAVLATTFGAYVAVPMTPVPMTLQPLFVILTGALLGPWLGAFAMATYVAVGAAGAPVFSAGNAGLPWLMGLTGGYLLSYPLAAFLVGFGVRRSLRAVGSVRVGLVTGSLAVGVAVMYVGGLSQLWLLTRQDIAALVAQGVAPFLVGDLVKVLIATTIVLGARRSPVRVDGNR